MGCLLYQLQNEELVIRFSFDEENRRLVHYSKENAAGKTFQEFHCCLRISITFLMLLCTEVPIMR